MLCANATYLLSRACLLPLCSSLNCLVSSYAMPSSVAPRGRLHGECFYGQIFEEVEHMPLIRGVEKYIERVRALL